MKAWVKVDERLPALGELVIVAHEHVVHYGKFDVDSSKMKQRVERGTTVAYRVNGGWNCANSDNDGHGDHGLAYKVTAWRKFPKAPKL